jgi:hypothetical protein
MQEEDIEVSTAPPAAEGREPEFGVDNPQKTDPREQELEWGVDEEDRRKLIDTVTMYRSQWAPDRLLRFPQWMKNAMFYRGQQILAWDPNSRTYFDALAWFRQEGKAAEGQDLGLEKYVNNITQMLGTGFVGTMSRGIPPTVIRPESAENLADVTTAKASQQAISIIERMNHIRELVREQNTLLYLYGVYFKYTRFVLDGDWAGYNEDPEYGEIAVQKPDRLHCGVCSYDNPVEGMTEQRCAKCGQPLGPGDFWPAENGTEIGFKGMKRSPKGMVKWTVHGPMEIDVDPQAKSLADTPLLVFDQEIDIGEARATFPMMAEKIQPGQDASTTPNASYERLRRNESYSMGWGFTSDTEMQRPTYSQAWLTPKAYWRLGDTAFAERMKKIAPRGIKLSMIGSDIVDIRPAVLIKEWSACKLHQTFGLYSPSIADNVVPFNERFNNTMQRIDDHIQRCSSGVVLADAARLDRRQLSGKVMDPGVLNFVRTTGGGSKTSLSDILHQFKFEIDQNIMSYPSMLLNFTELISGVVPQTFGAGTQEGIETARGQEQALSTAKGRLNIFFDNEKEEASVASQNAIECLQQNMTEDIYEVIQENGSEFRNQYVHLGEMQGRVKVYPDVDQGLPQSPEEIRQTFEQLVEEAGKGNPVALKMLDELPNQMQAVAAMGTPDMVVPGYAQQAKTQQDINTLMEKPAAPVTGPDGSVSAKLPALPEMWATDYDVLQETVKLFLQENCDYAQKNPEGWSRVKQYQQIAREMEMQEAIEKAQRMLKVHAAGAPPSAQQADPGVEAAKQELLGDAQAEVARLKDLSMMPPLGKNQSIASQVAAAGKIVDTALKAATA